MSSTFSACVLFCECIAASVETGQGPVFWSLVHHIGSEYLANIQFDLKYISRSLIIMSCKIFNTRLRIRYSAMHSAMPGGPLQSRLIEMLTYQIQSCSHCLFPAWIKMLIQRNEPPIMRWVLHPTRVLTTCRSLLRTATPRYTNTIVLLPTFFWWKRPLCILTWLRKNRAQKKGFIRLRSSFSAYCV